MPRREELNESFTIRAVRSSVYKGNCIHKSKCGSPGKEHLGTLINNIKGYDCGHCKSARHIFVNKQYMYKKSLNIKHRQNEVFSSYLYRKLVILRNNFHTRQDRRILIPYLHIQNFIDRSSLLKLQCVTIWIMHKKHARVDIALAEISFNDIACSLISIYVYVYPFVVGAGDVFRSSC